MKEIVKIVSLLVIITVTATNLYSEDISFRGLELKSSLDQIIEKEGKPYKIVRKSKKPDAKMFGDTWITYKDINVAGYKSEMQIELLDNEILSGTYSITADQKKLLPGIFDPTEYSKIYNDLYRKLVNKYGKPKESKNIDEFSSTISGLYAKSVTKTAPYKAMWKKDNGAVILILSYKKSWSLILTYMNDYIYSQLFGKNTDTEGL